MAEQPSPDSRVAAVATPVRSNTKAPDQGSTAPADQSQRPPVKRVARPAKPLPSLPPTPASVPPVTTQTSDSSDPAPASNGETAKETNAIEQAPTNVTPRGSKTAEVASSAAGSPAAETSPTNSDSVTSQCAPGSTDTATQSTSLASGASGAKSVPVLSSRSSNLSVKRPPPVPGRKVPNASSSCDRKIDEPASALSSSSSKTLHSSSSATSSHAETSNIPSPRGTREAPALSLTPPSPAASGEVPTTASTPRRSDEEGASTSGDAANRAKSSVPSTSSILSVFSSSLSGSSPVEDMEKRLRKIKEKREKLLRDLKRLEEEEQELEDKLREAREKEEKGEDRKKNSGGSRRGTSPVSSPSTPTLASGGSATSPTLGSAGSGISPSTASSIHRRVGSLVQLNMTKKKKKGGSMVLSEKDREKLAKEMEKEKEREATSSEPVEFDLSVPRQFYCKRTGSVTLKAAELSNAPPTKKYPREMRRKEVLLYIDSTGIQVMAHEERTARYPMSDLRNIGWSSKQFFLVVGKPNRRNVELFEFKTKEGRELFDWIMALKKDEKDKLSKDEPIKTQPTTAPETETVSASQPTDEKNAAADQSASPTEVAISPEAPQSSLSPERLDVRWSVAFIPPIVLDNENEDDAEESSGSTITHMSVDNASDDETEEVIQGSPLPPKKVDIHRETLLELVATERSYNADLDLIVELWMAKLKESKLVEPADLSAIFSNIEQIRNLNKELLNSLDGLDTMPKESLNVGERFQNFIAFLKLYTQYCSNYEIAQGRLTSLREAKWELTPFLESIQMRKECKNLDLESFLIKPMQRLTKYPLLIQALLKNTPPEHPDYEKLTRCYDGVQKVVLIVNENKRRNENLAKLMQIQQQFLEPGLKLVEATRKFIREGTFARVTLGPVAIKNCTVLLFNDIIVLAVKKKNKYQAKSGKITLRGSYVWEDNAAKNGFTVVGREAADKITVEAATEQEKKQWMDEISQALVHLPHNSLLGSASPSTAEKFVRQAEGNKE